MKSKLTATNLVVATALIAGLVAGSWQWAGAQQGSQEPTTEASQPADDYDAFYEDDFEDYDDGMASIASLIGIDEETLCNELDAGKSIAEVAQANGVDPQTIIDALVAEEQAFIDELVADGEITAEEAGEWSAELAEMIAFDVNSSYVDPFVVAAQTIGIEPDTLWNELDAGKTVADIAQANGVEVQAVVDAAITAENAMIDQEVAAGFITEEESQEWRAEVNEFVNASVNMTLDELDAQFMDEWDEEGFEDYDDSMASIATLIGVDEETLWNELDAGKSVAEVAQANGVDPQTIIDALVAEEQAFIDELVADGEITAEEATEWSAEMAEMVAFDVNSSYAAPFVVAAQAIGIDQETLWNELDAGKTVAEIAQANGVEVQAVVDAAIAAENAMIDQELAAGFITEAEAQEWRDEVNTFVNDAVNMTLDELDAQFMDEWDEEEWDDGDWDDEDTSGSNTFRG
ncbi:MAG: hypothetical protein AAF639_11730 [Chloroflexota bacterium]